MTTTVLSGGVGAPLDDSPPTRKRRSPGKAARPSREDVLDAAIDLLDRERLEAFSMRRLAQDLGIATMSLYRYFDTREEILDGACARVLGRVSDDLDEAATWEQQLTVATRDIYTALRTHPGVIDLLIAQGGLKHGPVLDPFRESLFSILYRAGFDDSGAVDGVLATFSFAFGAAVVEPARVQPVGPKLARFRGLSPTEFPSLTRAALEWATRLPGPAFESGLSHLINGMRADPRRTTT